MDNSRRFKPAINECPHCKSKNGYTYTYVSQHTQWMDYDGHGVSNTVDRTYRESKKRCIDCDKIIKEIK